MHSIHKPNQINFKTFLPYQILYIISPSADILTAFLYLCTC